MAKATMSEFEEAKESYYGWCSHCKEFTRPHTEPDAENYDCAQCGNDDTVCGAEQMLFVCPDSIGF